MSILSYTVNRVSIPLLVVLFIVYIVIHYYLLKAKMTMKKKTNLTTQEQKDLKQITLMADWFPAVYVIAVIGILYMV